MYNMTIVDWSSIFHFIYGIILAYFFRKKIVWIIIFIIGYEILELTFLPTICCVDFWRESPINIFADIIIGFSGYFIGKVCFNYYEKFKQEEKKNEKARA